MATLASLSASPSPGTRSGASGPAERADPAAPEDQWSDGAGAGALAVSLSVAVPRSICRIATGSECVPT